MFRIFSLLVMLVFADSLLVSAQSAQSTYLTGKQYFNEGKYNLAIESFKQLANPNAEHGFREYASFFYGLSAYKNAQLGLARSMWLQMVEKYPSWNRIDEVNYWLAQVYFEEGKPTQGTYYAKKSQLPEVRGMLKHHLGEITDPETLIFIQKQYPEDKEIGYSLAELISNQPLGSRDFALLSDLIARFNFNSNEFGLPEVGDSQMKNEYNVAVLMPFLFDGLDDIRRVSRNRFVMDLYEGMVEGAEFVSQNGAKVRIRAYDTRRNEEETRKILDREEMKSMDLIVGPLFPGPSKVTSDFCFEYQINMINPVSSNSRVIQNNPYSFLFKPSSEIQGIAAAEYAKDKFENRNTIIFYNESEQDSLMAARYREKIVAEGYDIIHYLNVNDSLILRVNEMLTQTYEDTLSRAEADSVSLIPGRIVKERKPRDEKGNITYENDSIEYYEEHFVIAPDSIGHIFLASSNPLHAANLVSAVEIRNDTIPLIGRGNWTNFEMLTMEELEGLDIVFVDPNFSDPGTDSHQVFRTNFHKKYKKEPSLNNKIGYELLIYVGTMMQQYGHYFQKGGIASGFVKGKVLHGTNIGAFNFNQVVPITRLKDSYLQVVNETN